MGHSLVARFQVVHITGQSVIAGPHDIQGQRVRSKCFTVGAVLSTEQVYVQLRTKQGKTET